MKTTLHIFPNACPIAAAILLGTVAMHAAPSTNAPAETRAAETNTIPKSVYNMPATVAEGRDPFFPNRLLNPYTPVVQKGPNPVAALQLKSVGGTAGKRIAMINNRTFAEGEEQEVPTANGRVQVRCVEIRNNAVVIEVDGERQELKLRSGI